MPEKNFTDPVGGNEVPKVDDAIAVGEDLAFQEKWWKFERAVWFLFLLVLLADVLGLFGRGWLSKAELHGNNGLDVKYERVQRAMTPSIISLAFQPAAVQNGAVQLFVSNSLIKDLGTQRVVPQPEHSTLENGGILYTFPSTGAGVEHVDLELQPSFPGAYRFKLQVPGRDDLNGRVIVVP